MVKRVLKHIYMKYVNSNYERKNSYLRKQGAKIGNSTIIISNISSFGSEPYLIEIGSNCVISSDVSFFTHDGAANVLNGLKKFEKRVDLLGTIKIGNNCFIGARSIILRNITIGNNCVVGAGAVVTKDIPDNTIVAGVPAKVICSIDDWYEKIKDEVHFTKDLSQKEKKEYCIREGLL